MIIINGERWRVRLVPPSDPSLIFPSGKALGCCSDITKTIYINNTLSPSLLKKVLLHEITHAVLYSYNISIPNYEEEIIADLIATYGNEIVLLSNQIYDNILTT